MSTAQAANVAISFTGTCDQVFNDDQKQTFRAQILQEVRQSGVCSAGDVLHLCSDESYTVGCDQSGSNRRRRATEPADVLMLISFYLLNRCVRTPHVIALTDNCANGLLYLSKLTKLQILLATQTL